jgi:nucleoid DNA-binding protein
MGEYLAQVPDSIRAHLAKLAGRSSLPETEESLEALARVWLEKKRMFEAQIRALDMLEAESLSREDPRGALLLTSSASLLGISPPWPAGRRLEYTAIELRTDVPHLLVVEAAALEANLAVGQEARFAAGAIRSTSPLLKIAVCDPSVSPEEQQKRLREAAIYLTNSFVRINRTVVAPEGPEQFNRQSLVGYLAKKNGQSRKAVRQLLEDYHLLLEAGLLIGGRVRLGRIGTLYLRKLPPRKARVGVNPATGQRITLPARPEEAAPRFSFSRLMKERARQGPAERAWK